MLRRWNDLPDFMKCDEVKFYYDTLLEKKFDLFLKQLFDIIAAFLLLIVLCVPMLVIAVCIKLDSEGPVFYRQERVTAYGKIFKIHKFRTMVNNAERIGSSITVEKDNRITQFGAKLRNMRLDEFPQLIDILQGNMSFVGTRPETVKYVRMYTKKMNATLLLKAGITSDASIKYKEEAALMGDNSFDADKVYLDTILPQKMKINLLEIEYFSFLRDIKIMTQTVLAVFRRDKR